jgi:SAM-dependent methyltransferase
MNEVDAYARLAGVYDEIVVDPCFPLWADFLDGLWSTDVGLVTTVLDVCCGTGLMYSELQSRGYQVCGVDGSEAMIARAHQLLGPDADLLVNVLPDLTVDGPFDAAISTFDGLNYLTLTDFAASLIAVAERVRPGGWLVFDLHTDAMLALAADRPVITGDEAGVAFTITNSVDGTARTCVSRIEVTQGSESFAEVHLQHFHDDATVRAALETAGFDHVAVLDEYTHAPAGLDTLRATWVTRRAG